MDPDPADFVIDLQDASKKLIFNTIFSAYYFLKVHLHNLSNIKSQKEPQHSRNQGFSYYFLHDCAADFSFAQLAKGKKFRP